MENEIDTTNESVEVLEDMALNMELSAEQFNAIQEAVRIMKAAQHRLQADGACAHEWDGGYPNDDNVYCVHCGMVRPAAKA